MDDPKAIRPLLCELIRAYIKVVEAADKQPGLSVKGLLWFYIKALWWEINFLAFPFIYIYNFFSWLTGVILGRKGRFVEGVFIRYSKRLVRSFVSGDIFLLKFITIGAVTKLFVYSHLKSRAADINRAISYDEIECRLGSDDPDKLLAYRKQKTAVLVFQKTIPKGIQLRVVFSAIAPVIGFVGSLLKLGSEGNMGGRVVVPPLLDIDRMHWAGFSMGHWTVGVYWFFILPVFAIGTIAISCFMQKRILFLSADIYQKEKLVYTMLQTERKKEFPYDLLGYMLLLIIYGAIMAFPFGHVVQDQSQYFNMLIVTISFIALFVFTWIRRSQLGKR